MTWRERWAGFSARERRLMGAAGGVLGLFLVHLLVISPFLSYRQDLQDEIAGHREKIENGQAYLTRTADITRQREQLQKLYQQVHAQLVPGDTPTLAAANLQNTLHSLAGEKGVEIQSTQVMRDDTVGEFRRIAVRITVTGDLKQVADFLAGVEHGPTRVLIPFLEISRRGAVLRGKAARALSATIEVTAFLQGAATQEAATGAGAEGKGAPAEAPAAAGKGGPVLPGARPNATPSSPSGGTV
jgi:Tfp pilus assembly protein PilO